MAAPIQKFGFVCNGLDRLFQVGLYAASLVLFCDTCPKTGT